MKNSTFLALCAVVLHTTAVIADDSFQSTATGTAESLPRAYVPPMISNGGLCMLIDYQGGQTQRDYVKMTPSIWWEGRRYGPAHDHMVPFGHFDQQLYVGDILCDAPTGWSQTLNTQRATVACRNEYGDKLIVDTVVFVHLSHDLIVVKKRISTQAPGVTSARLAFRYQLTPPGDENRTPRRMVCTPELRDDSRGVDFRYQVDGHRPFAGMISLFSDDPVRAVVDSQKAELSADVTIEAAKPSEVTFFLLFEDSIGGKDYLDRAAELKSHVRQEGFNGMLASHQKAWEDYWNESYVRIPDERLQKVYCTAQYHLRANATQWSFPVGIFPTHWAGKYFGWDEMFCYQALASSNHLDIASRCPEFRLAILPKALYRAAHYGKPGRYGARFPWEALEDGTEGAPPGFWMDHVFHMSNISLSAWFQYLYTDDREYLTNTGYPVIKECARFFLANMVYDSPDGGMFIGKCTDLERLGPAKRNPFMTSCGAIYTLESAAQAAAILDADADEAADWKHAAAELRKSLPHDGDRYVPYAGCQEESVASLGGLFPYPLFDKSNQLQRNAVYHFVAEGKASGNMYPVGQSICPWYAGWMAAALAALGDSDEPYKLLDKAAEGAGCFGELFEINEPKVAMHPWFATASGNVVYAMNQMLLQSQGDRILVAPAVPESWNDYSFKLACHGDLVAETAVKGGRLTELHLLPGNVDAWVERTLVIPSSLLEGVKLDNDVVLQTANEGTSEKVNVRFKGTVHLVTASN